MRLFVFLILLALGAVLATMKWGWEVGVLFVFAALIVIGLLVFISIYRKVRKKTSQKNLETKLLEREARADVKKNWKGHFDRAQKLGADISELPFYALIGEPSSGKTKMLNSALRPVGGQVDAIQGVAGTVDCDWYLSKDAVILDTAGRLSFHGLNRNVLGEVEQSSPESAQVSQAEWSRFIQLLGECKPQCPINGVIVAIPCTSLDDNEDDDEVRTKKAGIIAAALSDFQASLQIRFPVYIVFTKCDMIAGFQDFCLQENVDRDQILGWSRPHEMSDAPLEEGEIESAMASIVANLRRWRLKFLQKNEYDEGTTQRLFGFPEEMAGISKKVERYLTNIFGESYEPPFLRGIYFTSGEQDGTAMGSVMEKMLPKGFDSSQVSQIFRGVSGSKSVFIKDLYKKKIFKERGLVRPTKRRSSRAKTVARFGYVALTIGMLALGGWLFLRLWENDASEIEGTIKSLNTALLRTESDADKIIARQVKIDRLMRKLAYVEPPDEKGESKLRGLISRLGDGDILRVEPLTEKLHKHLARAHNSVFYEFYLREMATQVREGLTTKKQGQFFAASAGHESSIGDGGARVKGQEIAKRIGQVVAYLNACKGGAGFDALKELRKSMGLGSSVDRIGVAAEMLRFEGDEDGFWGSDRTSLIFDSKFEEVTGLAIAPIKKRWEWLTEAAPRDNVWELALPTQAEESDPSLFAVQLHARIAHAGQELAKAKTELGEHEADVRENWLSWVGEWKQGYERYQEARKVLDALLLRQPQVQFLEVDEARIGLKKHWMKSVKGIAELSIGIEGLEGLLALNLVTPTPKNDCLKWRSEVVEDDRPIKSGYYVVAASTTEKAKELAKRLELLNASINPIWSFNSTAAKRLGLASEAFEKWESKLAREPAKFFEKFPMGKSSIKEEALSLIRKSLIKDKAVKFIVGGLSGHQAAKKIKPLPLILGGPASGAPSSVPTALLGANISQIEKVNTQFEAWRTKSPSFATAFEESSNALTTARNNREADWNAFWLGGDPNPDDSSPNPTGPYLSVWQSEFMEVERRIDLLCKEGQLNSSWFSSVQEQVARLLGSKGDGRPKQLSQYLKLWAKETAAGNRQFSGVIEEYLQKNEGCIKLAAGSFVSAIRSGDNSVQPFGTLLKAISPNSDESSSYATYVPIFSELASIEPQILNSAKRCTMMLAKSEVIDTLGSAWTEVQRKASKFPFSQASVQDASLEEAIALRTAITLFDQAFGNTPKNSRENWAASNDPKGERRIGYLSALSFLLKGNQGRTIEGRLWIEAVGGDDDLSKQTTYFDFRNLPESGDLQLTRYSKGQMTRDWEDKGPKKRKGATIKLTNWRQASFETLEYDSRKGNFQQLKVPGGRLALLRFIEGSKSLGGTRFRRTLAGTWTTTDPTTRKKTVKTGSITLVVGLGKFAAEQKKSGFEIPKLWIQG
ncbi:MAG: type VI secretion protein IcmF/TssM N-terminal domain-containing protein [Planctomycetota bacterium]